MIDNFTIGVSSALFKRDDSPQKIRKEDITLTFLLGRQVLDTYKLEFLINIALDGYGETNFSKPNIDFKSFEESVLASLFESDRKYFIINSLDYKKIVLYFDYEKWFKDATANVKPTNSFTKFGRELKFRIQPPKSIMYDIGRGAFGDYLERKFKEYISKKRLDVRWFKSMFKNKKIRSIFANMFHYSYDFQFNKMLMQLKPQYIFLLLYGLTKATRSDKTRIANDFDNDTRRKMKRMDLYKDMFR